MKNGILIGFMITFLSPIAHGSSQEPPGLMITQARVEPATVAPWKRVLISCRVHHGQGPMHISRVGASVFQGDRITVYPVMYDDGTHGDITAGDGIYSFEIRAPETSGDLEIVFHSADSNRREIDSQPIILKVK